MRIQETFIPVDEVREEDITQKQEKERTRQDPTKGLKSGIAKGLPTLFTLATLMCAYNAEAPMISPIK